MKIQYFYSMTINSLQVKNLYINIISNPFVWIKAQRLLTHSHTFLKHNIYFNILFTLFAAERVSGCVRLGSVPPY